MERWKAEAAELLRREEAARAAKLEEARLAREQAEEAARAEAARLAEEAARREREEREQREILWGWKRRHAAQLRIRDRWREYLYNKKKEPAAVRIQANFRGWIERERGASLVGGKSHFDFPRRLEEMSLPFQPGSVSLSAKGRADLNFVVTTLKSQKSLKVRVVGSSKHTEQILVAKRRSQAITEYLLQHGVLKRQLRPEAVPPPSVGGIRSYGVAEVHFRVVQSLILPRPLAFESNAAVIAPKDEELLEKVAATLEAHPSIDLLIEGHADSHEAHRAEALSTRRAEAIKKWLQARGARCTLTTASFGTSCPMASNLTWQGRKHNRRVEIQLRPRG